MKDTIGIVGAGPFGLALAHRLGEEGRSVLLWSQDLDAAKEISQSHRSRRLPGAELSKNIRACTDPAEFAEQARFLVLAVSSKSVRERLLILGKHVGGNHLAVHGIGALAGPEDQRITKVISQCTPILRSGVIAGPSMPADLLAGRSTSLVCASEFDEVTQECRRLLAVPSVMRIYRSRDVRGVEIASALSGAYTIAMGLADELKVGIGTRAVLVTRVVSEMIRLGKAVKAESKTFSGLAGLGNLLVRSSVEGEHQSPSYRLGRQLVHERLDETIAGSEGARAAKAGLRLASALNVRLPVLETIGKVLDGDLDAASAAREIVKSVAQEE